jgi:hypothetical protein
MSTELIAEPRATTDGPARETEETQRKERLADSRSYLGMGVTIGVVGVASAALIGATCPVCVVAAPALIGAGIFKRWQARRK